MRHALLITLALFMFACDRAPGPDSISSGGAAVLNDCTACHGGTSGTAPNPIVTNGSGTAGKHVAHVTSAGLDCGWCHFDFASHPEHTSGTGSSVIFNPVLTGATWSLTTGPTPTGLCGTVACHMGTTPATPDPLNWYGPDGAVPLPACMACHSTSQGTRRAVLGSTGDFASNPSILSRHAATTADPTPDQCKVCHDMALHKGGTVRLRNADTGAVIPYSASSPTTLEPFCLSCHDADGALTTAITSTANPFNDGNLLGSIPYAAGTLIASSWSGSSTHRSNGLTCAGTGSPGTGCHGRSGAINMHGSANRGLLTNTMNFQIPLASEAVYAAGRSVVSSYDGNNYRLCFDCHASYPAVTKEVVLGGLTGGVYDRYESPVLFNRNQASGFRDYYNGTSSPFYSDTMWGYPRMALHNYHLLGFESRPIVVPPGVNALQWMYRGNPAWIGRITCTACHSVHGTAAPTIGGTYELFGLISVTAGTDVYVSSGTGSFVNAPSNCAVNCHGPAWPIPSIYWNSPAGE